jgi:acyl-coenzyme A synthetase/AMP-(fatty) acid ligase
VKIRGARVELDGVETAIRRHPSVRDVGVVVRIDSESGLARLVAYVQPPLGVPSLTARSLAARLSSICAGVDRVSVVVIPGSGKDSGDNRCAKAVREPCL